MSVVGDDVDVLVVDGGAAIGAASGFADQAVGAGLPIAPQLAAGGCIQRPGLVPAGHIHHAVDDDRRRLQARGVEDGKHPAQRQPADVFGVDLVGVQEAVGGVVVVARPIHLGQHWGLGENFAGPFAEEPQHLAVGHP